MPLDICIVTASNDDECLTRNLMASDMVQTGNVTVHVERGAPSAAVAYNRGLAATTAEVIVFAHQDVYFPRGWEDQLARVVETMEMQDPNWAIIAPCGISVDGQYIGDVWSSSLGGRIGAPLGKPHPVQSVDELVIVMRRASGLRWDEDLPNFHMYGTDIVQTALAAGQGAWVVDLPVVHNDSLKIRLGADFATCYRWMQRKWRTKLPIQSTVMKITRLGLALPLTRRVARRSLEHRRTLAVDPMADPRLYAAKSGLE